jgi:hypothetical protein
MSNTQRFACTFLEVYFFSFFFLFLASEISSGRVEATLLYKYIDGEWTDKIKNNLPLTYYVDPPTIHWPRAKSDLYTNIPEKIATSSL